MEDKILEYINSQSGTEWVSINDYLKQEYGDTRCRDIRTALVNLVKEKNIIVKEGRHRYMCIPTKINPSDEKNTQATLDNWELLVKLDYAGRKKIADSKKQIIPHAIYNQTISGNSNTVIGDGANVESSSYNISEPKTETPGKKVRWYIKIWNELASKATPIIIGVVASLITGSLLYKSCNQPPGQSEPQKNSQKPPNKPCRII